MYVPEKPTDLPSFYLYFLPRGVSITVNSERATGILTKLHTTTPKPFTLLGEHKLDSLSRLHSEHNCLQLERIEAPTVHRKAEMIPTIFRAASFFRHRRKRDVSEFEMDFLQTNKNTSQGQKLSSTTQ